MGHSTVVVEVFPVCGARSDCRFDPAGRTVFSSSEETVVRNERGNKVGKAKPSIVFDDSGIHFNPRNKITQPGEPPEAPAAPEAPEAPATPELPAEAATARRRSGHRRSGSGCQGWP